jgi:ferric-dicitrate binding protein FerR (iron transport regulator)
VVFFAWIVIYPMNGKMKNLNKSKIDQLIQGYSEGKISRDDMLHLERWVQESDTNLNYFFQYKNILDNSSPLNINNGLALEKVLGRISTKKQKPGLFQVLFKIAAVLFIPLLISTLFLWGRRTAEKRDGEKHMITMHAAFGCVSSFKLDDGSAVWLNSGSSLSFPEKFTGEDRLVYLTGEAYFEVKSNEKAPFIVQAERFTVKATGTRFNVMSYTDQPRSITLAQGKVILIVDAKNQPAKALMMKPNQHISIDRTTAEISTEFGDTYKHYSWKDGKLIFRNDLMEDVMQRISLQYNVDIEIADDILLQNRYRATFENESLTDVLDLLKLASPFKYRQINPVSLPDGSYTRKKIIISKSAPIK